jgi:hypothetical protein
MDINDLIKGEKYTIIADSSFGDPINVRITFGEIKQHGYNLFSGAWALYPEYRSSEANFLICKRYRKKKFSTFNIKDIISVKKGW